MVQDAKKRNGTIFHEVRGLSPHILNTLLFLFAKSCEEWHLRRPEVGSGESVGTRYKSNACRSEKHIQEVHCVWLQLIFNDGQCLEERLKLQTRKMRQMRVHTRWRCDQSVEHSSEARCELCAVELEGCS